MALPNALTGQPVPVPQVPGASDFFMMSVLDALARITQVCPEAVAGVDVGVDEVPDGPTILSGLYEHDAIPVAAAMDADAEHPARIVVYRRPLEHRAQDRDDLRELVHEALVDQLSALTGRSVHELDPDADDD